MGKSFRLTAVMASRKLAVLAAIRSYWSEWGGSPAQSELRALTGFSTRQVHEAVHRLARDGTIVLKPGARGIFLPDLEEALRRLVAAGFIVNQDDRTLHPLATLDLGTKTVLPPLALLDHIPSQDGGGSHDGEFG